MAKSTEDSFIEAVPIVNAEDIMRMADPALSCENALSRAPYVISSLGHLLLISAETDFSLIGYLPENTKFKYLKYADSFRACLVQVSNGVWRAFQKAHDSMERIRLKSLNIDRDVKKAVKFIKEGTENELSVVRACLTNVDKQSDECVHTAASITEEFQVVVDTMNELLEACTGAKGRYDKERKETNIAKEAAAKKQKNIEEGLEDLKVRCDEEKNGVKKAGEEYDMAFNSYPSTWKIMLCGSVDQIARLARDITVSLVPAFLLPGGLPIPSSPIHASPEKKETVSPAKPTISDDEAIAFLAATDILKHAGLLLTFENNDQNGIQAVREWFQKNLEELRESQSDAIAVKKAVKLCEDGVERCQDVLNCLEKSGNTDESAAARNPTKRTYDEVTKNRSKTFYEDAMFFYDEATKALSNLDGNVNDDGPQPVGGSLTTILLQNAERKRQEALNILNSCYERYERCHNQMLQERKEMEKVLDELAKFDHQTVDLDKIRDALRDGMKKLCKVIKHWKRFQEMFEWLRGLISDRFKPCLDTFQITAKVGVENFKQIQGSLTRKTIIKESEEASQIANMVQSVSVLYLEVSQRYLLNEVISLQKMVSLDVERDREKMENMRKNIRENCKRAQVGIQILADERRKKIHKKTMRQMENNDKLAPPLGRDEAKRVGHD